MHQTLLGLLPGYEDHDYKKFEESILAEYPGVEKGTHYHVRDLDRLIKKHAASDMTTETELLDYYHDFLPIAAWLLDNNDMFWSW